MNDSEKKNNFTEPPIQSLHTLDADLLASIQNENYTNNIVKVVSRDTDTDKKEDSYQESDDIGLHTLKQVEDKHRFTFNLNRTSFYFALSIFLLTTLGITTYYIVQKTIKETLLPENTSTTTANQNLATTTATTTVATINAKNTLFNAEILMPISISGLTKDQIIQLINKSKNDLVEKKIKNNINIGFTTDVDVSNFFNKIQYSGPDTLIRSLDTSKTYGFGLYHTINNTFQTYILLKIDTFDLAFSGTLDWERSMFVDLQNIFTYTAETETSTSSQTLTKEVTASKVFTDEVVKNIDTRWYVNNNTKILYGFINKEYLLITSGEESFIDIVNKLTKNNILR